MRKEDLVGFAIAWVLQETDGKIQMNMQIFIKECVWDQHGWKGRKKAGLGTGKTWSLMVSIEASMNTIKCFEARMVL